MNSLTKGRKDEYAFVLSNHFDALSVLVLENLQVLSTDHLKLLGAKAIARTQVIMSAITLSLSDDAHSMM